MPAQRKAVHVVRLPIRWGDMDAQGHVNNTVYFRYMEQARIEWLAWLDDRCGGFPGQGSVIVNASCTFLVPMTHPGTVEVRLYLDAPGRSSIGTHYELRIDGKKYAEGSAKLVWVDQRTLRSVRLPERVAALTAEGVTVTGRSC
ncbi:MAG: acyl-CoA thioesterase [Casimicrobiaceae bacterium]